MGLTLYASSFMEQGQSRLLYRYGGLKGVEIGAIFGINYSAASQERKRLRERLLRDCELDEMIKRLEGFLLIVNGLLPK